MTKHTIEIVFKDELRLIRNDEIRKYVISCTELVPDYFWDCPASTSGKYHPAVSLGKQGLIRHTKLAVWWGVEIYRCWPNINDPLLDEVVAALILHDIRKNGDALDTRGYPTLHNATKVHGVLLAEKMWTETAWSTGITAFVIRIHAAIAGHMGIWTADEYEMDKPENQQDPKTKTLCYIVHLADYCASRKCDSKAAQLARYELPEVEDE